MKELNNASQLQIAMTNACSIINKDYLKNLSNLEVIEPSLEDIDVDITSCGSFFKLTKLVLSKDENFIDKLTTITNVVNTLDGTLVTIIDSKDDKIDYYIGVVSKKYKLQNSKDEAMREAVKNAFSGAIKGNFAGSVLNQVENKELSSIQDKLFSAKINAVSAVSGVVSRRDKIGDNLNFVQGIENLANSLRGINYTVIMVADSLDNVENIKEGYQILQTELSVFEQKSLTLTESDSISFSEGTTTGISNAISDGITKTQTRGYNSSTNTSTNHGYNIGGFAGVMGFGGVNIGANTGYSSGSSQGSTFSSASGLSTQNTYQTSKNESTTNTNTTSTGKNIQISIKNKQITDLIEKIELNIKRLNSSFGIFDCSTYILCENEQDILSVSSNYSALMKGEESFVENSNVNVWIKDIVNPTKDTILKYLKSYTHPKFKYGQVKVSPATQINGMELAIQFGLPKKSINGLPVVEMIPFGRNVIEKDSEKLELGKIYYMGNTENTPMNLDINSLASHTFVTGSTGSGKSNTIYEILHKLRTEHKIPFLVIEPAKGEYKNIFGNFSDVTVYGTNHKKFNNILKINPFKFNDDVHILEHLERLVEIFNVCWSMYAAMPAVLKEAIEKAYEYVGWDLVESTNFKGSVFPNFTDVLNQVENIINSSEYSEELKGNYKGALCTRIRSLTTGLNALIFTSDDIDDGKLFDENVIIDLSRVGSTETKSLIMGLIVMRLNEYRMSNHKMNSDLKHITVLEEAHNLLKSTSSFSENSNLLAKSVEMLTNSIAEMRTFGEGFIIADQSPGLLDLAVIRNTNTKIVLRLPEKNDRELVGKSVGLYTNQIDEISKLEQGVAIVYQNDWIEPVLSKINKCSLNESLYKVIDSDKTISTKKLKKYLVECLMNEYSNYDFVKENLSFLNLPHDKHEFYFNLLSDKDKLEEFSKSNEFNNCITNLFDATQKIENVVCTSQNFDILNNNLNRIVEQNIGVVDNDFKNNILKCFMINMKNMPDSKETRICIYNNWEKRLTEKLL